MAGGLIEKTPFSGYCPKEALRYSKTVEARVIGQRVNPRASRR